MKVVMATGPRYAVPAQRGIGHCKCPCLGKITTIGMRNGIQFVEGCDDAVAIWVRTGFHAPYKGMKPR